MLRGSKWGSKPRKSCSRAGLIAGAHSRKKKKHAIQPGRCTLNDTHKGGAQAAACVFWSSPASMSLSAKSPMRTSPLTVHFCVSQFGLQLWLMNRAEFPLGPASITRSCIVEDNSGGEKKKITTVPESWCRFPAQESHLGTHECHLGECEHVEVGHVIFVSAFDPLLALLRVDHLPHVLGHKVAL